MENNESLKSQRLQLDSNSDQIHKLYESILEIRRITIDEKTAGGNLTEKEKKDIFTKISDMDFVLKHLREQFDENNKIDEPTDEVEDKDKENQPASMRDYIRHVAGNLKVLGEKVKIFFKC